MRATGTSVALIFGGARPSRRIPRERGARHGSRGALRALLTMRACSLRTPDEPAFSQPPIDVCRILADRRLFLDQMMERREMAHGVGRAGIARECEGLAAAAAEIEVAPVAALARLGQKRGAAKCVEGRIVLPDVAQRMVLDRPEFEAGD